MFLVAKDNDTRIFIDLTNGMFENICLHRDRFEESSKKSARNTGTFDPWNLVDT